MGRGVPAAPGVPARLCYTSITLTLSRTFLIHVPCTFQDSVSRNQIKSKQEKIIIRKFTAEYIIVKLQIPKTRRKSLEQSRGR